MEPVRLAVTLPALLIAKSVEVAVPAVEEEMRKMFPAAWLAKSEPRARAKLEPGVVVPRPRLFLKYAEVAALPATSSWASEVVALGPRRTRFGGGGFANTQVLKRVQRPEPAPVRACEIVSVPPRATEPPPVTH